MLELPGDWSTDDFLRLMRDRDPIAQAFKALALRAMAAEWRIRPTLDELVTVRKADALVKEWRAERDKASRTRR